MKLYKLPIILYEPCEDTNDMYMAEAPLFPGCRAWVETASLALAYIQGVAEAFVESYTERGLPLPIGFDALAYKTEDGIVRTEVSIAPQR